jgi:alanyl-tRNA synthetase
MSGTVRLYHEDSLLLGFRARVTGHGSFGGAPSVLLDRTAFYPEAGGQMADRGMLAGLDVRDVQEDDEGRIHHVLAGPLPEVGTEVEGSIDRARRRVHMALHTSQHMLSRALLDVAGGETVSARLGESACTIDLDLGALDERKAQEAEDLVNGLVDDDVAVRAYFPEPGELGALPLRRAPKVQENVRVVVIGDFDVTPCGGTHCTRTAQVGLVRVEAVERYKGKARVVFTAGARARRALGQKADLIGALAREMTCGPEDVKGAIEKLRRELGEAREALGQVRGKLANAIADELLARAGGTGGASVVVAHLEDAPLDVLRAVAGRITASGDRAALLCGRAEDGGAMVVCARGGASTFDCGAFLKRAAQAAGGRGGGRPERAEGRLPGGVDWYKVAAAALSG